MHYSFGMLEYLVSYVGMFPLYALSSYDSIKGISILQIRRLNVEILAPRLLFGVSGCTWQRMGLRRSPEVSAVESQAELVCDIVTWERELTELLCRALCRDEGHRWYNPVHLAFDPCVVWWQWSQNLVFVVLVTWALPWIFGICRCDKTTGAT